MLRVSVPNLGKDAEGDQEMTWRRLFVGLFVVSGVSVWSWCRADVSQIRAESADPVYAAGTTDGAGDGNHDEAVHRFRTNQAHHWRQIMLSGR